MSGWRYLHRHRVGITLHQPAGQKYMRYEAIGDDESQTVMLGKGMSFFEKGFQMRLLKVHRGYVEALVLRDNFRPSPDGIGMMGTHPAGQRVFLQQQYLGRWNRDQGFGSRVRPSCRTSGFRRGISMASGKLSFHRFCGCCAGLSLNHLSAQITRPSRVGTCTIRRICVPYCKMVETAEGPLYLMRRRRPDGGVGLCILVPSALPRRCS